MAVFEGSAPGEEDFLLVMLADGFVPVAPTVGLRSKGGLFAQIQRGTPDVSEIPYGITFTDMNPRWGPPVIVDPARSVFDKSRPKAPKAAGRVQKDPTQSIAPDLRDCYPSAGPIHAYMEWAHRVTHTPPQFHLAAILPPVATEANRRGWTIDPAEPMHIWSAIVAGAAIGKTTAATMAEDFTRAWMQRAMGAEFQDTWTSLEGSLPGVYHALTSKFDERTGTTVATLSHSELSRVLRSDDALEMLCMLFDTRDVQRNLRYYQKRKDDGDADENEGTIRSPRISALVTTTQASLEDTFRAVMLRGGLASRLVWFTGTVTAEQLMPRERVEPELYSFAQDEFWRWSGRLATMESRYAAAKLPKVITVSDAADDMLTSFYDGLRERIVDQADPLASVYQRSTRMALRIAGIYALSLGRTEIDVEDLAPAMRLIELTLGYVGSLTPSLTESKLERNRGKLMNEIRSAGQQGIKKTRAFRLLAGLSKFEIDNVLADLVEMELILDLPSTVDRLNGRGRPTQYLVAANEKNAAYWVAKCPRSATRKN